MLGIDAAEVLDVIVWRLHSDHAGGCGRFPKARFHLQETEMAYATGRCMSDPFLRDPYTVDHVVQMVREVFAGPVAFADGDRELAPGLSVHLIGGHAKGIQATRVRTARGWVVLASDATHYYENFETYRPFIITHDVEATVRGYDRLRDLATSIDHIVPGHDTKVMQRYPAPEPRLEGVVARLDVEPSCPEPAFTCHGPRFALCRLAPLPLNADRRRYRPAVPPGSDPPADADLGLGDDDRRARAPLNDTAIGRHAFGPRSPAK